MTRDLSGGHVNSPYTKAPYHSQLKGFLNQPGAWRVPCLFIYFFGPSCAKGPLQAPDHPPSASSFCLQLILPRPGILQMFCTQLSDPML